MEIWLVLEYANRGSLQVSSALPHPVPFCLNPCKT